MPEDFDRCVREKGRVRTMTLKGGKFLHVCYDKAGKSHAGEIKQRQGTKGKQGGQTDMVTVTDNTAIKDTGKEQAAKPPVSGAGLDGEKGRAETKEEKVYRQSEVDALLGKAGQRIQVKLAAVVTERDTLKSQFEATLTELNEVKESLESVNKDIEALSSDDPEKTILIKRRKELEVELRRVKAEGVSIAEDKNALDTWKRDQEAYTVASEYVTATGTPIDLDSFKNIAEKLKVSGRESLEDLAATLGYKPKDETTTEEAEEPPIKPISGKTLGGVSGSDRSSREKIRSGFDALHPGN